MSDTSIMNDRIEILQNDEGTNEATTYVRLRVRRKTSSQWTSYMEVIPLGEPCYSIDTGEVRIGDGQNVWNNLSSCLGVLPELYRREYITGDDGVVRQYTRILIDDGELS